MHVIVLSQKHLLRDIANNASRRRRWRRLRSARNVCNVSDVSSAPRRARWEIESELRDAIGARDHEQCTCTKPPPNRTQVWQAGSAPLLGRKARQVRATGRVGADEACSACSSSARSAQIGQANWHIRFGGEALQPPAADRILVVLRRAAEMRLQRVATRLTPRWRAMPARAGIVRVRVPIALGLARWLSLTRALADDVQRQLLAEGTGGGNRCRSCCVQAPRRRRVTMRCS
jgi:hypothetical protein